MKPKVLVLDIETAPLEIYAWGLWDINAGLNQIKKDWHLLSWSAKWLGSSKIMYMDQRNVKDKSNDKKLLEGMWKLLNEADIILTQNGKRFDEKKLNARFVLQGLKPPSSFKHIDVCKEAKRVFGFTSHKLEYMTHKLCKKYKKLKVKKFQGQDLWTECLNGNKEAWREMETYNKHDVLSLEELYYILEPWIHSVDFNLYSDDIDYKCNCGSKNLKKNGFFYSSVGKFQRYYCGSCKKEVRGRKNLLSKEKRTSLKVNVK